MFDLLKFFNITKALFPFGVEHKRIADLKKRNNEKKI
jgi:hypothetical protein